MLVRLVHQGGGPLDGTIEFDEELPDPGGASDLFCLARGTYEMTGGEVGMCVQVGETPCTPEQGPPPSGEDGRCTTLQWYVITKREVVNDVVCVTFELSQDDLS